MSTNDVPGANPANNDELKMGCWAEHDDGSLIFVESTEGGRVIYSMFDLSKDPPMEYRDAMPEPAFKKQFTWDTSKKKKEDKWLWHDKSPMPWERIIKSGFPDGARLPSVEHIMTAAERLAERLKLHGKEVASDMGHRFAKEVKKEDNIWSKLARAIESLGE